MGGCTARRAHGTSLRSSVLILLLVGCVGPAPVAVTEPLVDPRCEGTQPGNACLSLHLVVTEQIRESSPRPLSGRLGWGVFRGGDVGAMGPGANKPMRAAHIPSVDFATSGTFQDVTIPNLSPIAVQILAHLDTDGDRSVSNGDPVTFPSASIEIPGDLHTKVTIPIDYLR